MISSRTSFWLTLIFSLLSVASGAFFVIRHLTGPSDGARLDPGSNGVLQQGLAIQVLNERPGELLQGDIVIAVNDRSIESWTDTIFEQSETLSWSADETLTYRVIRSGEEMDIRVTAGDYPIGSIFQKNWGTILFGAIFLIVGGFVFIQRPDSRAGQVLFLSASGLAGSTAWSFGLTVSDFFDGTGFLLFKVATFFFYNLAWTAGLHFALIFPQPFSILKKRWFLPLIYILPFVLELGYLLLTKASAGGNLEWILLWSPAEGIHAASFLLATLLIYLLQFARAQSLINRQQILWVLLAGLISSGGGLVFYLLPPLLGLDSISPNMVGVLVLTYPFAIAIAILRHNLFNIDFLINRTLVYGTLTASTMFLYVGIVGFLGSLLQPEAQGLLAFAGTGLIALVFQPIRNTLQRLVNRFMYGDRDNPYSVVRTLGKRLQNTLGPRDVIPAIVETVSVALKLPYTGISLKDGDHFTYGVRPAHSSISAFPLAYQGETFGQLEVAPRSPNEPLTEKEISLINDLARQIEVAVHDVQLNKDLQRSRQRLITAREEERRRIRRDLHDGLGPQLASQMLTLDAMDKLLEKDPEKARSLLQNLKSQSQHAIADIRGLIYGLRPPALDDLGLIAALKQEIEKIPGPPAISIQHPDELPPLPAALEVALYRIILEGINNTVRHAEAESCLVKISLENDQLDVIIRDDGSGLPEKRKAGVGLQAMRERAEELGGWFRIDNLSGGGTSVQASIPITEISK